MEINFFEIIGKISALFGIDLAIIIILVIAVQIVKVLFKPSKKLIFIILFAVGVFFSVFNIIFVGVPIENILRVAFGYPVASMCLYMIWDKFLKKKAVDFLEKFKLIKDIQDGA